MKMQIAQALIMLLLLSICATFDTLDKTLIVAAYSSSAMDLYQTTHILKDPDLEETNPT